MWDIPCEWTNNAILASGSNDYLNFVLSKLRNHHGIFVYATDYVFKERRAQDVARQFNKWAALREQVGLESHILAHEEFGGISSAFHLVSFKGVDPRIFSPHHALPRVLAHVLNAATTEAGKEIARPHSLGRSFAHGRSLRYLPPSPTHRVSMCIQSYRLDPVTFISKRALASF